MSRSHLGEALGNGASAPQCLMLVATFGVTAGFGISCDNDDNSGKTLKDELP